MSGFRKYLDFTAAETLQNRLDAAGNRPSGFDYMRLFLALAVIGYHSIVTSYGDAMQMSFVTSPWRAVILMVVPMFFCLSGFLVAGSLERSSTLMRFLGMRTLRIVPALACEVVLSALILGPLLTAVSFETYYSSPEFFSYFGNLVGNMHYRLPGVFSGNPLPHVINGQLWTVPYELGCYLALAGLYMLGIFKNRRWLLAGMALLLLHQVYATFFVGGRHAGLMFGSYDLIKYFLAGLTFYKFRDKIPYTPVLFFTALIVSMLLLLDPDAQRITFLPIAYVTVYLGLLDPPRSKIALSGDYSYGLFLYGFVIQQTVASFGPAFQHWYVNLLIAVPVTCVVAAGSWRLIEKPALGLRRYMNSPEDWYIRRKQNMWSRLPGRLSAHKADS
ncbi:MAG: acyltransferase family protein [Bdellovibrionales bacterium]